MIYYNDGGGTISAKSIFKAADELGEKESVNKSGDNSFLTFLSGVVAADKTIKTLPYKDEDNIRQLKDIFVREEFAKETNDLDFWKKAQKEKIDILEDNAFQRKHKPYYSNYIPTIKEYIEKKDKLDYANNDYSTNMFLDKTPNYNVKAEQRFLNNQGITNKMGERLKEDGLAGANSLQAVDDFVKGFSLMPYGVSKEIERLRNTNKSSPLRIVKNSKEIDVLLYKNMLNKNSKQLSVFRVDEPHDAYVSKHFNVQKEANAKTFGKNYSEFAKINDHKYINNDTFDHYVNFDNIPKAFKKVGKVAGVVGGVLDAIDIGSTMYYDLNDEDKKIGKSTIKSASGVASSWAG
ncbi:MAG: hypothetical protein RR327_06430, partial [Clostridia bacterium]